MRSSSFRIPYSLISAARRESEKQQQIKQSMKTVNNYEKYINNLISFHKNCISKYDWLSIEKTPPPIKPIYSSNNEVKAQKKLSSYKPNIIEKIFTSLKDKKLNKLTNNIEESIIKDKKEYNTALLKYEEEYKKWDEIFSIAKKINERDPTGYIDALEKFYKPSSKNLGLGEYLNINIDEHSNFEIYIKVYTDNYVIPTEICSLTKMGRLSKKNMPISKFNELYKDYVCSVIFRLSRDIFAFLPIDIIYIHVSRDNVDKSIGKIEEKIIISITILREKLNDLNFELIDPYESLKNFSHNIKYFKNKGFFPVDKIEITK